MPPEGASALPAGAGGEPLGLALGAGRARPTESFGRGAPGAPPRTRGPPAGGGGADILGVNPRMSRCFSAQTSGLTSPLSHSSFNAASWARVVSPVTSAPAPEHTTTRLTTIMPPTDQRITRPMQPSLAIVLIARQRRGRQPSRHTRRGDPAR